MHLLSVVTIAAFVPQILALATTNIFDKNLQPITPRSLTGAVPYDHPNVARDEDGLYYYKRSGEPLHTEKWRGTAS